MADANKAIYVFNKFFLDLLKDLKNALRDRVATTEAGGEHERHASAILECIRANYAAIDKFSADHVSQFAEAVQASNGDDAAIQFLPGHKFGDILAVFPQDSAPATLQSYLAILKIISYVYLNVAAAPADDSADGGGSSNGGSSGTLTAVLESIKRIQEDEEGLLAAEDIMDSILDDDLRALLVELMQAERVRRESEAEAGEEAGEEADAEADADAKGASSKDGDTMQSFFDGSVIGKLAKEISEEIDVSDLQVKDPTELLDFQNLARPDSALGKVVSTVGAKLQEKMSRGNLSQADLLGDAMKMMAMLNMGGGGKSSAGNNPLMGALGSIMGGGAGGLAGMMGGGGNGPRRSKSSRRGGSGGSNSRGKA